jgi:16S rRNA (guanine527-N7)-methyltransferase
MTTEIISKYFPDLPTETATKLEQLKVLYADWNEKINVISRKDMEHFYERHVLHSLSIAHYIQFKKNNRVLDIGTGGGFPGIPLAIMFPEVQFFLVDSIGKKIKVVHEIATALQLKNVTTYNSRVEDLPIKVDYTISRAVAVLQTLHFYSNKIIAKNIMPEKAIWRSDTSEIPSSLICLKGGDLNEEMSTLGKKLIAKNLSAIYAEDFFETKKMLVVAV